MDTSKESIAYSKTKIKICGLSRETDIAWANELSPDYIGFVFAQKSRRYVSPEKAGQLKARLDGRIQAVGVFVNEPLRSVQALAAGGTIDVIQLHGDEDEAYIAALRNITDKPIIRAFRMPSPQRDATDSPDIEQALTCPADYILLDNGNGGTGQTFDWSLMSGIRRPYFLAGGLDCRNISEAVSRFHPFAVDVSSGAETDGHKDYHKMKELIHAVRNTGNPASV